MDASRIDKPQMKCRSVRTALASAVLEWFLIFLLFIEAILSYLITTFASYYELQTPCLLCSRLDHVFGSKKLKYCYDLICGKHKLEISSLVLCHAHNKLVDVHGMCESCLFSFATINKSNAETYRLLVGKLGEDSSFGLNEDRLLADHASSAQRCSCCNEMCVLRGNGKNLTQTNICGSEAAEFDASLSAGPVYDQENLNMSERRVPVRDTRQRSNGEFGHLSHVGYTELKVDSDTASELLFSDGDDDIGNAQSHSISSMENAAVGGFQTEPQTITLHDDLASEKLMDSVTELQTPISASLIQTELEEFQGVIITPTVSTGHGLEELHRQQVGDKSDSSAMPELISINEFTPSSTDKEIPVEAAKERDFFDDIPSLLDAKVTLEGASKETILISVEEVPPSSVARETSAEASELSIPIFVGDVSPLSDFEETPFVDALPSSSTVETPMQELIESCITRTEEACQTAVTDSEAITETVTVSATMNETASETSPVSGDNGQQATNILELGDAYKLAVGNKGRQFSGVLAEPWSWKDSSKLSDDLKMLLSQLSAARELTMNDISPKVTVSPKLSINSDDLKNLDASSSIGIQLLQKRISLERNESSLSMDGSIVSEIEGESAVDHLKRQIEHDRRVLSALYKELEEERNASAISANQAMAMITRLQEEKATLQMEASQCLRMMEEQAEYDSEALQKTSDILAEREKEIQDLEAELEFYRNIQSELMWEDNMQQFSATKTKATSGSTIILEELDAEKPDKCHEIQGRNMSSGDNNIGTLKDSSFHFDDERAHILQCLKDLEKRLSLLSNIQLDSVNSEYSGNVKDKVNESKHVTSKLGFQVNREADEIHDMPTQKDGGNGPLLLEKSELISDEYDEMFYSGQNSSVSCGWIDLDVLAKEVFELNERLKALEADRNLLRHSINSIRNGEEGLQFIQEIASQLKEIRKLGTRGRQ